MKLHEGVHAYIIVKYVSHFSQNFAFCCYPVLVLMYPVAVRLLAFDGDTGRTLDLRCPFCVNI